MNRILIAEDELIIAKINAMLLEKIGYQVEIASTAEKALEALEGFKPDVILMDIKFKNGGIDGIAAAHRIREKQETPIIFISGNSPQSVKEGVDSIENSISISKPIDFKHLTRKLEELV